MSSLIRLQSKAVEPIEDRIDSLFREIELSVKWQRPSILIAAYSSEYIHGAAEAELEHKIVGLDQKVVRITIENKNDADIAARLSEYSAIQNAIFFINGLRWGCLDGANIYLDLNNQREFFVEKQLRMIFWLTEKEVIDLANQAPDFWAFRHRVIEFSDSPNPEQILQNTADATWQGTGEYTDPVEDIEAKISFRESLLTNLPDGNESASVNGNLLLTLGILHWRKGDYEKASEFLKTALDVAISMKDKLFTAECFNAIALVKTGLGRTNEAIEAYQRAIQLAPNQMFPWNNLGILFNKLDRNEDALVAFKKAIENKPGDSVSWNGLGEVYMKLNQPDDAIRAYLKAIEFTPRFESAWCGLGNAFASAHKTDFAFKAYQKAFALNNRSTQTIIGLARILAGQGRENNAIKAYEAALNLDPKNAITWDELGMLCLKTGSQEKAIVAFEKAIELSPNCGTYYSNQALAYLDLGVHLEAIPLFEKSLSLFDSDEDKAATWNRLGNAYRQIGDYDRAVSAYQIADELKGQSGNSLPKSVTTSTSEIDTSEQSEIRSSEDDSQGMVEEATIISSSLDSKESRVEMNNEQLTDTDLTAGNDEMAQVLDGDNLKMLDKTISEIEEMISRQSSLVSGDSADTGERNVMTDEENENNIEDDGLNALEWNELGNTHLISGCYDEAIFAYTRAIELAPEFNWPYIKNLAMAYYQKGKGHQDDLADKSGETEREESGEGTSGLDSVHDLEDLSTEIFSSFDQTNASEAESTVPAPVQVEEYSFDGSSLVEPFSFDSNVIGKDLLQEAMQEDMEFNTGKLRDGLPASRELVEKRSSNVAARFDFPETEIPQVEINPGKEKFEVQPKNAYEWNELGNIYLKIGSNDKASEAFNKAIAMDPYFGWAYSNLALAYNHSKKFQESIPLYRKSIDLIDTDKGKAISYNRLGDVYRHLNDQENAMKAYQMASDLDGNTKPILARARMVLLNNV
jgi:tetratricopeptide (TPR) repeat protein